MSLVVAVLKQWALRSQAGSGGFVLTYYVINTKINSLSWRSSSTPGITCISQSAFSSGDFCEMSSFKRKDSSKQSSFKSYTGTRASPASSSTINTSTGITSLDDILGGGLPLSCSLVVAAPDPHSLYGSLVQKYFVAEGLACGHRICIFDGDAEDFLKDVMWYPKSTLQSEKEKDQASPPPTSLDEDEEKVDELDQKVKIAWRYEQLKPFQTTIIASSYVFSPPCIPLRVRYELSACKSVLCIMGNY